MNKFFELLAKHANKYKWYFQGTFIRTVKEDLCPINCVMRNEYNLNLSNFCILNNIIVMNLLELYYDSILEIIRASDHKNYPLRQKIIDTIGTNFSSLYIEK